jgi:hypothetical protein
MNNYNNRGSYNNGKGNYGNGQRGGYQNSRGNYNNTNGQQEQQNEKKFGAKFRLRGIVCTDKQTGEGFTRINTKNGSAMCSVNVMIAKYQNTGDRDRDGNPVWKENTEFFRLIAFGPVAETVMGMAKAKSTMEFTGEIRMQKGENGFSNPSFVIEKIDMIKEYSGSNSNNQGGNYQRNNGQREGYRNNGYQKTNGNAGGYNYEDRPNNYSQRSSYNTQQNNVHEEPENDYAPGDNDNDIPF